MTDTSETQFVRPWSVAEHETTTLQEGFRSVFLAPGTPPFDYEHLAEAGRFERLSPSLARFRGGNRILHGEDTATSFLLARPLKVRERTSVEFQTTSLPAHAWGTPSQSTYFSHLLNLLPDVGALPPGIECNERLIDVLEYLQSYPGLRGALERGLQRLRGLFGRTSRGFLRLVAQPDVPHDEHLYALLATSDSPADALRKMDVFLDSWWIDQPFDCRARLTFDVIFE